MHINFLTAAIIDLFAIITLSFFLYAFKDNEIISKIMSSLIIACGTFLCVGIFGDAFQYQANKNNFELNKTNEPLILANNKPEININNEKNIMKITFHTKQGTITKGEVIYFNNEDKNNSGYDNALYIPATFNNKTGILSTTVNITPLKELPINIDKDINKSINLNKYIKAYQTQQFGLILKDSKNNIVSGYYIVRPEC